MNIKKLLAGSLAAIAAGATLLVGIGAASNSLGDYVVTSDGSLTSPIIVVGSAAKVDDVLSAADIAAAVAGYATKPKEVTVGGGTETTVNNGVLITSGLNKTYIGESFNTVKSTLTKNELPTLLTPTTFTDMNSSTVTVQYQINLGSQSVNYGKQGEMTEPDLYVTFDSNNKYNLTAIFIGGLDTSAVSSDYNIKLFGKTYTFGSTHTNSSLELYSSEGALQVALSGAGTEKTVNVGGKEYKIKLVGWSSDGKKAYIQVNDVATPVYGWEQGHTYQLTSGSNIKVYVKSVAVLYTGAQEATGSVQLFIGTDKLELTNNNPVEKNDETLANTKVYFDSSGSKINKLTIEVAPDVTAYMTNGGEFVDPIFGTIKFKLNGMTPSLSNRDVVSVTKDGTNKVKLTFKNKDGTEYSIPVFYYDTTNNQWEQTYDGTHKVWVKEANVSDNDATNDISLYDYLVVSSNKNTYVLKYSSYHYSSTASERYVTLKDVATGADYKVYYNSDPYLRIGAEAFKLSVTGDESSGQPQIAVDLNGNGNINPTDAVNISTETNGLIDISTIPNVVFYENPLYTISGSNEPTGGVINVSASYSSNDINFASIPNEVQVGTENKYRKMTNYGTLVERNTDADTVTISYPGERPAYANVAVGSDPQIKIGGAGTVTVEEAIKITTPVAKLDTEVDTTALTGDLILVGGPCVNTLVADLLKDTVTCETWNYTIGIIKEVENAFGSGHKALIVAGTTKDDTRSLAAKVMKGTLSFEA